MVRQGLVRGNAPPKGHRRSEKATAGWSRSPVGQHRLFAAGFSALLSVTGGVPSPRFAASRPFPVGSGSKAGEVRPPATARGTPVTATQEVFESIAYCKNLAICRCGDRSHPCAKIVDSQHVPDEDFQLPEPWRGQIDKARVLFLGSNPSIGDDRHALHSSPQAQVWESQHLAFGGGSRAYIVDGIRAVKPDGSSDRVVRYWSSIRARARELIPAAVPGEDYAISEIVHCKSKSEEGVAEAAQTCYATHMSAVFSVAAAKVVIVLGKFAKERLLGAVAPPLVPSQLKLGGRIRTLLFLPHPNARGVKKALAAHYTYADLEAVRELIAEP